MSSFLSTTISRPAPKKIAEERTMDELLSRFLVLVLLVIFVYLLFRSLTFNRGGEALFAELFREQEEAETTEKTESIHDTLPLRGLLPEVSESMRRPDE